MTKKEFKDNWMKVGAVLFEGNDDVALDDLGDALWNIQQVGKALPVDADFNVRAHQWFHTIGAAQLTLILHVIDMSMPMLAGPAAGRIAEDLFHIGFMAGVANERGLLAESDIDDAEDARICLLATDGGLRTADDLEAATSFKFIDEELQEFARLRKLLDIGESDDEEQGQGYW